MNCLMRKGSCIHSCEGFIMSQTLLPALGMVIAHIGNDIENCIACIGTEARQETECSRSMWFKRDG